jgi:hypothetical protein
MCPVFNKDFKQINEVHQTLKGGDAEVVAAVPRRRMVFSVHFDLPASVEHDLKEVTQPSWTQL